VSFEQAFEEVILVEGGYSNNPKDSGGKTKFGVTEAVARECGYLGDMKDYTVHLAEAAYAQKFWHPLRLDEVDEVSPALAMEMFEFGVNSGIYRPAIGLQHILNVLNREQRDYEDIITDGVMGPGTIRALKGFHKVRGAEGLKVLVKAMNCYQGQYLISLAEKRPKDEEFIYGWLKNRISLS